MQFEPDAYNPQKSIRKNGCSIFWGEEHGKLWKNMFTAMSDYITTT